MIEFQGVSKVFAGHPAVKDLTLELREGAFSVLVGTSGSGKSTTLKMINRLLEPDRGTIRFAGEDIRQQPVLTLRRRMGYAIQSIGLFPHWTVAQNIATVPQLQRWPRARIADRIDELMALLGLEATLRDRYPHQLSGGQQQRVGVARALAADPEVLLMDEPFGALDPVTREALQQEMLRIHRLLGRTIVLVTHDIDEALRLADHLVLMDGGEVVQQGRRWRCSCDRKIALYRPFWPQRAGCAPAVAARGGGLFASRRTAGGRGADHHHDPAGSAVAVCRPALRDAAGGRCRRQALRYAAFCRSAAPGDEP